MNCAKDKILVAGILLTVISIVSGVLVQQVTKAGAEVEQVRKDYRDDIKTLELRVDKRLDTIDKKLDTLIEYQLDRALNP